MKEKWQVQYRDKKMASKVEDFTSRKAAMDRIGKLEEELNPSAKVKEEKTGEVTITIKCPRYVDGRRIFSAIDEKIKSLSSLIELKNLTHADATEKPTIKLGPHQRINRHGIITDERSD